MELMAGETLYLPLKSSARTRLSALDVIASRSAREERLGILASEICDSARGLHCENVFEFAIENTIVRLVDYK